MRVHLKPTHCHTESNYSFAVTPALLKFSLNITSWNWNSSYVLSLSVFVRALGQGFTQM
jgi:hypothetical protein